MASSRDELMQAIEADDHELIRQILNADPDVRDVDGFTAVFCAALEQSLDAVQLLVEHGCNVTLATNAGTTPLHVAAIEGHAAMVQLLLEHGAEPRQPDSSGDTAIDWAATAEIRQLLLQ